MTKKNNNIRPCVIGLGYVGLPIFLRLQKKFNTSGFDIDKDRIQELIVKKDRNFEYSSGDLVLKHKSQLTFNSNRIQNCNFYIVCVPTPIFKNLEPNLNPIKSVFNLINKIIKEGDIVMLESTVFPGVTEDICAPILEKNNNFKYNKNFFIGYSPERINPGDAKHSVDKIKKIIALNTNNKLIIKKVINIYKTITKSIVFSKHIRESETAKLIENIQRDLNIALMNELLQACQKLKINFFEVKKLAETKWNFLKFEPGLVGGHCLPVDPHYLSYITKKNNYLTKIILSGRSVNNNIYKFVESNIAKLLKEKKITHKNSRILIVGLSYKPNVADMRNSIANKIFKRLNKKCKYVACLDPVINQKLNKEKNIFNKINNFKKFDLIVPLVNHTLLRTQIKILIKKNYPILDIFGFYSN